MQKHLVFLSIPGLRPQDVESMPRLSALMSAGSKTTLTPSFPAATWPTQANMLTGKTPNEHGVIGNGFFWRDTSEVEMWTAWNDKITAPQIWDLLHERDESITSAVWFPMLSKGCGADYICMPKPIHNPDGSESLWCYTKPVELYGELRDAHGHFPLKHFWGPLANIQSTAWIADSAVTAANKFKPNFFYLYLPHLDYAAQKTGPDSDAALKAVEDLDEVIGRLADGMSGAYGESPTWMVASEYAITPVDHVTYPNRVLREAGLLQVVNESDGTGEVIDFANSQAWALADHQFAHVFVKNSDSQVIAQVAKLFDGAEGMAEVLTGTQRDKYSISHERAGDVVLISTPNSWQAYYYWLDDAHAPSFARTVDIHRKPGYDPVEMHFDMATRSIPLDATLVKGSHGAPVSTGEQQGVILCSQSQVLADAVIDTDVCNLVLSMFS